MKDKTKGLLHLIFIVIAIVLLSIIAVVGIGKSKYGSMSNVKLGLDLAGGVSITYEAVKEKPTSQEMEDTKYRMQQRAEMYSKESVVYLEGDNRINVDIPSATDANEVLAQLGNAGTIYFIYGQSANGEANLVINDLGILSRESDGSLILARPLEEIIASGDVVIDGADIVNAEPMVYNGNMGNEYVVALTLNSNGAAKFAKATEYAVNYRSSTLNLKNLIMIVYDGKVVSAPGVTSKISDGKATISGQASFDEAKTLASTIRIGALPLELKEVRSNVVGAKLGTEAINTSLLAGAIGFIIVILFMIIYYRIQGVAASIALLLYVGLMILALNIFGVTLTLPGIAGIILSIGMAVDANVIIFARTREELATGKTVRSSMKLGYHKALSAIIDGNVTTLIAAAVLFLRGSGTVKGFAETLALGIVLSMFTALFVTKFVMNALYNLGFDKENMFGVQKPRKTIDFIKHGKKFAIISGILIIVGFVGMIVNQTRTGDILNFGLDFKGGSSTQITFPNELSGSINQEMEELVSETLGITCEPVRVKGENTIIIKTKVLTTDEKLTLEERLISEYNVDPSLIQTNSISATISGEMKSDAIWAVIIAGIGILFYIWIRFKDFGFAGSSVIALLHDVLVTLTLYAIVRISVSSTFIACMLTLVGYSINATIVIFDRVRDSLKEKKDKDTYREIMNRSITDTLSRSINTSLTTLIMILILAILGVSSVKEFAIPLLFGIACGTYSSICIAGNLWYFINKRRTKEE